MINEVVAFGLTGAELLVLFFGFWMCVAVVAMICSYLNTTPKQPKLPMTMEEANIRTLQKLLEGLK